MAQTDKRPHHHGNLRSALIQAGLDMLREGGQSALTIRGVAARAGVSHAAPKHHFASLNLLKRALVGWGFETFREEMLRARSNHPELPALQAIALGYLRFAHQNQALFNMMFGDKPPKPEDCPPLEAGKAAYAVLSDACKADGIASEDLPMTETLIWSQIHGYTHLFLAGELGEMSLSEAETRYLRLCDHMCSYQIS